MNINLEILFQKPEKTVKAILFVEPLAPLSMVSTMPGSFYKTLTEPSKFHLCGAFENALGWHFDENFKNQYVAKQGDSKKKIRGQIKKRVDAYFKKQKLEEPNWEISEVGYEPLLAHLFDVGLTIKPPMIFYKDLWKQMKKRSDGYSHPNGTMNISHEIIPLKMDLERTEKGTVTNDAITEFYTQNSGSYPMYYTAAGSREFVAITEGCYRICLKLNELLFTALNEAFSENNLAYLGTNEGWVNLKIQKL
jgi:CRISPR-associated protein Cas5